MIVHTEPSVDFLPVPDELIVNLQDSKQLVLDLLANLPQMFEDSGVFDANLIQVIKAIGILTKPIGGKVYLFEASPIS